MRRRNRTKYNSKNNSALGKSPTSSKQSSANPIASSISSGQSSVKASKANLPSLQQFSTIAPSTLNTPSKKQGFEWVSIINLCLTAIIGIGGIIAGYYFNLQNGQIQRSLIGLQAETQREANLAHLQIECDTYCAGDFKVKNTGSAIATNVRISIVTSYIQDQWQSTINDINKFEISFDPASLPIKITETKLNSEYYATDFNNTYILSLDYLPPGETITIFLALDYRQLKGLEDHRVTRKANIFYDKYKNGSYDGNFIFVYFIDKLSVGSLNIDADCNNCENGATYKNNGNQNFISMTISSWISLHIDGKNSESYIYVGKNFNPKKPQAVFENSGVNLGAEYMLPKDAKPTSVPDPLNLQVINTYAPNEAVQECQMPDCYLKMPTIS